MEAERLVFLNYIYDQARSTMQYLYINIYIYVYFFIYMHIYLYACPCGGGTVKFFDRRQRAQMMKCKRRLKHLTPLCSLFFCHHAFASCSPSVSFTKIVPCAQLFRYIRACIYIYICLYLCIFACLQKQFGYLFNKILYFVLYILKYIYIHAIY